jgi:hypothetical protein
MTMIKRRTVEKVGLQRQLQLQLQLQLQQQMAMMVMMMMAGAARIGPRVTLTAI